MHRSWRLHVMAKKKGVQKISEIATTGMLEHHFINVGCDYDFSTPVMA